MADHKKHASDVEPFFFNMHNFDEENVTEPVEEEEPPPPTFSEEELATARQAAYESGRKDALAEAQASTNSKIAALMEQINLSILSLFEKEDERAALYEAEAIRLTQKTLQKLFPVLERNNGLDEILAVIEKTFAEHSAHNDIIIELHEDYADAVAREIKKSLNVPEHATLTVKPLKNIPPSDCTIRWAQGGAQRTASALAENIALYAEQLLAGKASLTDNETLDEQKDGDDVPAGHSPETPDDRPPNDGETK